MGKDIKQRLDELKIYLQDKDFLEGKGLSNEINFNIFTYEAKYEMLVQQFISQLISDSTLSCNIKLFNLYELFLQILEEKKINTNAIINMEKLKGKLALQKQLVNSAKLEHFLNKMQYENHTSGKDVVLITGVGDVFPFMRVHTLLNGLQKIFQDVPVVTMYPGKYDGHYVTLFNELKPNDYYRAFNIID